MKNTVSPFLTFVDEIVITAFGDVRKMKAKKDTSIIAEATPTPEAYLYLAVPVSGAIAFAITYIFSRIAVKNSLNFLFNAEEL